MTGNVCIMNGNDIADIIHVGPKTPMGNFMRQYWLPAALSNEEAASKYPSGFHTVLPYLRLVAQPR